jgi:hypothetical protein
MNDVTITVPVPLVLRNLIDSNNQLLKQYQAELTAQVVKANEEMMRMLQLDPSEGWRLDMGTYTYVKVEQPTPDDTPIS